MSLAIYNLESRYDSSVSRIARREKKEILLDFSFCLNLNQQEASSTLFQTVT